MCGVLSWSDRLRYLTAMTISSTVMRTVKNTLTPMMKSMSASMRAAIVDACGAISSNFDSISPTLPGGAASRRKRHSRASITVMKVDDRQHRDNSRQPQDAQHRHAVSALLGVVVVAQQQDGVAERADLARRVASTMPRRRSRA